MNRYLSLFISFFKLGLFTFGGGYAMLPLIERDVVEKKKMITDEEMTDILAVSESTPGPLAINCATFVGYKVGGFFGALVATLSVVFPSFIIILVISLFLEKFLAFEYVGYAFNGIRIAVAILILEAAIKMFKKADRTVWFYILGIIALLLTLFFTSIEPAFIILGGGLIGMIIALVREKIGKGENKDDSI